MKSQEQSYYRYTLCFSFFVAVASVFPQTCCFQINVQRRRTSSSPAASNLLYHPKARAVGHTDALLLAGSFSSEDGGIEEEDDEEVIDLSDQDWRNFRAKMVMSEKKEPDRDASQTDETNPTTSAEFLLSDPDDLDGIGSIFSKNVSTEQAREYFNIVSEHWAYESGNVIEQGAVILGGVEQEFGFGLNQQYFHKAAILVLYHDENVHTKGIILNRPSDRYLIDPDNPGIKWRVWFGGDVQGIDSWNPDIVCLHSLDSEAATKVSVQVMRDIKYTSFEEAKRLVSIGEARPSDFWVFCGYAGWGPKQLMGELERKSWYMVATDSQTLLQELARQASEADPRDAGLDTWELLMKMIGRQETAKETDNEFDDLMLKEWARKYLLSENAQATQEQRAVRNGVSTRELLGIPAVDKLIRKAADLVRGRDVQVGMLLRASSADRSPFLLDKQQLHKSIILIISDDDEVSIGVMLNRPTPNAVEMKIVDRKTGVRRTVAIPVRYGGEYAVKGRAPLLWLHCNENLRKSGIGTPLGADSNAAASIWSCHPDQVTSAIEQQLAKPHDFMVVSGVTVWTKGEKGRARGIQGEVVVGNFEVVPSFRIPLVFQKLLTQEVLNGVNLYKILSIGNDAWASAGVDDKGAPRKEASDSPFNVVNGKFDGYVDKDDSLVYKSEVKVTSLADDALKSWISTFLLSFVRMRKSNL